MIFPPPSRLASLVAAGAGRVLGPSAPATLQIGHGKPELPGSVTQPALASPYVPVSREEWQGN